MRLSPRIQLLNFRASVAGRNLPQLYRFCFLVTGNTAKAGEVFQDTVREAAFHSANGEPPPDRIWFFREAHWRCQAAASKNVPPEKKTSLAGEISAEAPKQIKSLEPAQLAQWIALAPEPQRSAMALYYINQFTYREIMLILRIKLPTLANALSNGRREFQARLDAAAPAA